MRIVIVSTIVASTVALVSCGTVVVEPSGSGADGTTSSTTSTSAIPCPDPFPGVLATCDVEGQVCTAPYSCCDAQVTCTGGTWQYQGPPTCQEACTAPCNQKSGFACVADAVCVIDIIGMSQISTIETYRCAQSPCDAGPLSCSCAAPLCDTLMCIDAAESTVTCHFE